MFSNKSNWILMILVMGISLTVQSQTPTVGSLSSSDLEEVIYESIRIEDGEGNVIDFKVIGDLDPEESQRVARPWSYFHEAAILSEDAWTRSLPNGHVEFGYRVIKQRNANPILPQIVLGTPDVDQALTDKLESSGPDDLIPLMMNVRNFPEWNIPLRPVNFALAGVDLESAREARAEALRQRSLIAEDLFAPIKSEIEAAGGEVVSSSNNAGWITARMPAVAVLDLLKRKDLRRVRLLVGRVVADAPIYFDSLRSDSYIDARQYLDMGYTGETANPTRHSYGDITVGVIEPDQIEADACAFFDGADCSGSSRLRGLYRCDDFDRDGNYCEQVSKFRDNDRSANHGTLVASVIAGDYTQGQGDPLALGDPSWTPSGGHSSGWENQNTGIAREASIVFLGQMADGDDDDGTDVSSAFADAFDDSIDLGLDITNNSWSWNQSGDICNLEANTPIEEEAEIAFDDGIFIVVSAGNPNTGVCGEDPGTLCQRDQDCFDAGFPNGCDSGVCIDDPGTTCDFNSECSQRCVAQNTACNIQSPATIPKTFAVNGLNAEEPNCDLGYGNCTTDADHSANGGINANIAGGGTCTGCVSGISMTTLTRHFGSTSAAGLNGNAGSRFTGTSASAPVVSGAAAIVKDWYVNSGQNFIHSPGRLHSVMLSMGDRETEVWGGGTSQTSLGADDLMGMGRLKMRFFTAGVGMDPWGAHNRTSSFLGGTPDDVYVPFNTPMPGGTQIVKCTSYNIEDMSSKVDISQTALTIRIREPVSGQCTDPQGSVNGSRRDGSLDIKKMAVFTSSELKLEDQCLEVTVENIVPTTQGVTALTRCYYSGVLDDRSAP